jgi:hypothetical protein
MLQLTHRDAQIHIHPRQQLPIRIRYNRPKRERPRGRIHAEIAEVERPLMRIRRPIAEDDFHPCRVAFDELYSPLRLLPSQLLDLRSRLIEIHVDRIDLFHRREQRRFTLANERTLRHTLLP